jgi:hypothetical protein
MPKALLAGYYKRGEGGGSGECIRGYYIKMAKLFQLNPYRPIA